MGIKHYLLGLATILLLSQCNKGITTPECAVFVNGNLPALEDCRNDIISEKSDIAQNLIGDWKLVSYGCGFCGPHTPPEAYIVLTETTGTLSFEDDFDGDTLLTFEWYLEEITNTIEEKATYRFKTSPTHYALNMDIFCDEFMFFDERPFDGSLFLYRKQ